MKHKCSTTLLLSVCLCCLLTIAASFVTSALYAEEVDIPKLRVKAERGMQRRKTPLGGMYLNGKGVQKNLAEALKWCAESC